MNKSEKHQFKAEIEQLLEVVINSLYTDKEIFVRELISNAADALEKLRFLQSAGQTLGEPDQPLAITIVSDDQAQRITFTDTGIGMTQAELAENLGTVAHSGSRAFIQQHDGRQKADAHLIGQFGVGFYSAFMVARKVEVYSRAYRPEDAGWVWTSEGPGGFTLAPAADLPRGTRIVLHLRTEHKEFAVASRLENIIKRYSNFVPFPIELNGKALNTVKAIWSRQKNEITEKEYQAFYHYIGHDRDDPLYRLHFTADAPLAIQALLFVPSRNLEALGLMRTECDVHLYCRKILISSRPAGLLPEWLRFLKGVVDSEDLPLNISRETLQDSTLMRRLNQVLTSRFIKLLTEQAEKNPETYAKFYAAYARFLKEGVVSDYGQRPALAPLLRYESSRLPKGQFTTFTDYARHMPADQKEIFFLLATHREAAENSPYYEVFRARGYEVLFAYDPWDEFVMEHLGEFDGKPFQSAEQAGVTLTEPTDPVAVMSAEESQSLVQWLKEILGDQVGDIRISQRLVDSPALLINQDKTMTSTLRQYLKSVRRTEAAEAPVRYDLEINPRHGVMARLEKMRHHDAALGTQMAEQILDNARIAAGLLENPRSMVKRLSALLEQFMAVKLAGTDRVSSAQPDPEKS